MFIHKLWKRPVALHTSRRLGVACHIHVYQSASTSFACLCPETRPSNLSGEAESHRLRAVMIVMSFPTRGTYYFSRRKPHAMPEAFGGIHRDVTATWPWCWWHHHSFRDVTVSFPLTCCVFPSCTAVYSIKGWLYYLLTFTFISPLSTRS